MSWVKALLIIAVIVGGGFYMMSPQKRSDIVNDFKQRADDKFKEFSLPDDAFTGNTIVNGLNVSVLFYGKPQKAFDCESKTDCYSIPSCGESCLCDSDSGACFVVRDDTSPASP